MPKVTFLPDNRTVEVPSGTDLLTAARFAELVFDAPCGGKGTCGKCLMKLVQGHVESKKIVPPALAMEHYVVSCRSYVWDTDIVAEIPKQFDALGGKFSNEAEALELIDPELLPKKWQYNPLVFKNFVEVFPARADDGFSDLDRLVRSIQQEFQKKEVDCTLPVLKKLPSAIRAQEGKVTVLLVRELEKFHLLDIEPGNRSDVSYGLAIDIGTTTVAVELIHMPDAKILAAKTGYNDQISCGLDVISRINYAKKSERLEELRTRVLETINILIGRLALEGRISKNDICNAAIAGNTTMIHLLLGIEPEHIRLDPYTPAVYQTPCLTAHEIGLDINPNTWISFAPAVGSYVGGDITAGLLCTKLSSPGEEINLFIDIGTNGEMVIGNNDFLMSCACSAGPAFEGGGMECGMRAATGAIERVEIDRETGRPTLQVIGNTKPTGICGSGMISLLANLFLTDWLDAHGKLKRDRPSPFIRVEGRSAVFVLATATESGTEKELLVKELDIDNIIRAKAAIYSALSSMTNSLSIQISDISTIYIAGGFGRFLDIEKSIVLGLLPDLPKERFKYIGNSSLAGAYMMLISQDFRQKQLDLAQKMTYLDIGSIPGYMDEYSGAMFLPHTHTGLFPSVTRMQQGAT
jgi:uncharacterized 2Fe-2S/4Fe-4S cluster protein (DUF4445 family)